MTCMDVVQRIRIELEARATTTKLVAGVLTNMLGKTEVEVCDELVTTLAAVPAYYPTGWYDPPPGGAAVLFGAAPNYQRLQFDTLRSQAHWPKQNHRYEAEGVAMVYVSPVDCASGVFGDVGVSVYQGDNHAVQDHFCSGLKAMEDVVAAIAVGMEFKEIYARTQASFKIHGLQNHRTVVTTDWATTNLGHTVPWTCSEPTAEDEVALTGSDFTALREAIRVRRVFINSEQIFKVPTTGLFTFEARVESVDNPTLPLIFFHFLVGFVDGEKIVQTNYQLLFDALGMSFVRSTY